MLPGYERGITVCAPVHDAVLIESADSTIERDAERCQAAMLEASTVVLDGSTADRLQDRHTRIGIPTPAVNGCGSWFRASCSRQKCHSENERWVAQVGDGSLRIGNIWVSLYLISLI